MAWDFLWPLECVRGDTVWLLRLGLQSSDNFCVSFWNILAQSSSFEYWETQWREKSHGGEPRCPWMPKEAIMDPLAPGKTPQPAPWEAEMSHSCWVETCSNCQPTGSRAAKGCCKPQNWGVICYTATDNWNKAFFPVFSELKLMKLLPFHSESKLGCQKWHLKSSTPHQQPSSLTGLQTAPNICAGKLTGESNAATETIPSARSTSYFFPFQGKMRSGGWGRGKWHRSSPFSKFQGGFFSCIHFSS